MAKAKKKAATGDEALPEGPVAGAIPTAAPTVALTFKPKQEIIVTGTVTRVGQTGNVSMRSGAGPEITLPPDEFEEDPENLVVGATASVKGAVMRSTRTWVSFQVGTEKEKHTITVPVEHAKATEAEE